MPTRTLQAPRRKTKPKAASRASARRPATRPRAATRRTVDAVAASPPPAVRGVLERLGRALSAGDLPGVSACFAYPSFLLTGADLHEFRDPMQVQAVFRRSLDWHASAGIVTTRPEFEGVAPLGAGIHDCTVRWPAYGSDGRLVANERAHYIIQETGTGSALIRVGVAVVSTSAR
jgi:hypothetical protein